ARSVPGQRGDAVAELDAIAREALGDFQRAGAQIAIADAMDRAFDEPRDHLLVAVLHTGEIDDLVNDQRPILHLAQHEQPPLAANAADGRGQNARRRRPWQSLHLPHGAGLARSLNRLDGERQARRRTQCTARARTMWRSGCGSVSSAWNRGSA